MASNISVFREPKAKAIEALKSVRPELGLQALDAIRGGSFETKGKDARAVSPKSHRQQNNE